MRWEFKVNNPYENRRAEGKKKELIFIKQKTLFDDEI